MKNLEKIRKQLSENADNSQYLDSTLWEELYQLANSPNPKPTTSMDYLIVLSSNTTQLKRVARPTDNVDLNADYDRFRLAIKTVREIAAIKLSKNSDLLTFEEINTHGPSIIYVGMKIQSEDLLTSFGDNEAVPPHSDFPLNKVLILTLDPSFVSSKAQFVCIGENIDLSNATIGWVTHAFHFMRVSRQISKMVEQDILPKNCNQYAYLVDREFNSNGILENIVGEIQRIPEYISKGDLALDSYEYIRVN